MRSTHECCFTAVTSPSPGWDLAVSDMRTILGRDPVVASRSFSILLGFLSSQGAQDFFHQCHFKVACFCRCQFCAELHRPATNQQRMQDRIWWASLLEFSLWCYRSTEKLCTAWGGVCSEHVVRSTVSFANFAAVTTVTQRSSAPTYVRKAWLNEKRVVVNCEMSLLQRSWKVGASPPHQVDLGWFGVLSGITVRNYMNPCG